MSVLQQHNVYKSILIVWILRKKGKHTDTRRHFFLKKRIISLTARNVIILQLQVSCLGLCLWTVRGDFSSEPERRKRWWQVEVRRRCGVQHVHTFGGCSRREWRVSIYFPHRSHEPRRGQQVPCHLYPRLSRWRYQSQTEAGRSPLTSLHHWLVRHLQSRRSDVKNWVQTQKQLPVETEPCKIKGPLH